MDQLSSAFPTMLKEESIDIRSPLEPISETRAIVLGTMVIPLAVSKTAKSFVGRIFRRESYVAEFLEAGGSDFTVDISRVANVIRMLRDAPSLGEGLKAFVIWEPEYQRGSAPLVALSRGLYYVLGLGLKLSKEDHGRSSQRHENDPNYEFIVEEDHLEYILSPPTSIEYTNGSIQSLTKGAIDTWKPWVYYATAVVAKLIEEKIIYLEIGAASPLSLWAQQYTETNERDEGYVLSIYGSWAERPMGNYLPDQASDKTKPSEAIFNACGNLLRRTRLAEHHGLAVISKAFTTETIGSVAEDTAKSSALSKLYSDLETRLRSPGVFTSSTSTQTDTLFKKVGNTFILSDTLQPERRSVDGEWKLLNTVGEFLVAARREAIRDFLGIPNNYTLNIYGDDISTKKTLEELVKSVVEARPRTWSLIVIADKGRHFLFLGLYDGSPKNTGLWWAGRNGPGPSLFSRFLPFGETPVTTGDVVEKLDPSGSSSREITLPKVESEFAGNNKTLGYTIGGWLWALRLAVRGKIRPDRVFSVMSLMDSDVGTLNQLYKEEGGLLSFASPLKSSQG